jgi:hypothetical protein
MRNASKTSHGECDVVRKSEASGDNAAEIQMMATI